LITVILTSCAVIKVEDKIIIQAYQLSAFGNVAKFKSSEWQKKSNYDLFIGY
jgi:hypothetical protein